MKRISSYIISILLLSMPSFAHDNNIVGFGLGYGSQDLSFKEGTTAGDNFNIEAYYRYMFRPELGAEIGWSGAVGGINSILVDIGSEIKDVSYDGFNAGIFYQYPILKRVNLTSKLGVNRYVVDYTFNNRNVDDFHIGYEASVGIEARANNGLGINFNYKYINNSIIESNQFILGTSFRF